MSIDETLLWEDVPTDDWRRVLVEAYGLHEPPGYWKRAQEGFYWFRSVWVRKGTMIPPASLRYRKERELINTLNRWPLDAEGGEEAYGKFEAGSPEAIEAWSADKMRAYAKDLLPLEIDHGQYPKPPAVRRV